MGSNSIVYSNLIYKGASTCIYSAIGSQGASFNPNNSPLIEGQVNLSNWSKSSPIRGGQGPSCLPCHYMLSICTLVIYLCTLDGLELHWVQGGPIVTLARLFLFLFTPYSNWPNTCPKTVAEMQAQNKPYTTLYNVYKTK